MPKEMPAPSIPNPTDNHVVESETDVPLRGFIAETQALKALQFYAGNYTNLVFRGVGGQTKKLVLGNRPYKCRFCGGIPPKSTFKKRAHAVSHLLGNKAIISLYECDKCNERFSSFEDDLGKMTLPMRSVGGVLGTNGVPKLELATKGGVRKPSMSFEDGGLHLSHSEGDVAMSVDQQAKTVTVNYVQQPYRPLGAYKALCKSAYTLLPEEDLPLFEELRLWLLEDDLETGRVYASGSHTCYSTFVPAFQPFKQPIVALLKRHTDVTAPFLSFFIATGNVSYQIFLPCPSKDGHLRDREITFQGFPHFFQLQPWLVPGPIAARQVDLSDPERTKTRTGAMVWKYESRVEVKVEPSEV